MLQYYGDTVSICIFLITALCAAVYFFTWFLSHKPRAVHPSELKYTTLSSGGDLPDLLTTPAEIAISVVVPCYNEEERLPLLLQDAITFLFANFQDSWEIIIVDDGSKDRTREVALNGAEKLGAGSHLRYTKLVSNRGKGGAVTHGVKVARGALILFADADNASDFAGLKDLENAVSQSSGPAAIAIGSRAHLVNTSQVIKRTKMRNFLMRCFHLLVYWFGIRTIRDTQCGFKLYTRDAAQKIFPYMHTEGWIFDVETLVIAMRKSIPIYEIPISWHEVDGSKIDLTRDSIKMAIDLIVIRFAYLLGIYNDGSREEIRKKQ